MKTLLIIGLVGFVTGMSYGYVQVSKNNLQQCHQNEYNKHISEKLKKDIPNRRNEVLEEMLGCKI